MFRLTQIIGGTLVLAGVVAVAFAYFYWNTAVHYGSMAINYARYLDAPKGTLTTEVALVPHVQRCGTIFARYDLDAGFVQEGQIH